MTFTEGEVGGSNKDIKSQVTILKMLLLLFLPAGLRHRLLYTWTEDWIIFFPNSMAAKSAKYGFTIICRYSKDMNFHKIWRV